MRSRKTHVAIDAMQSQGDTLVVMKCLYILKLVK